MGKVARFFIGLGITVIAILTVWAIPGRRLEDYTFFEALGVAVVVGLAVGVTSVLKHTGSDSPQ